VHVVAVIDHRNLPPDRHDRVRILRIRVRILRIQFGILRVQPTAEHDRDLG
jgi:hypothetical protein